VTVSLHHIVIDAHDLPRLAAFWAATLHWQVLSTREREVVVGPDDSAPIGLCFMPSPDDKAISMASWAKADPADLVATVSRDVTVDEVKAAFKAAADEGSLAGKLIYTEDPLVSTDIVGSPASCTFDASATMVIGNVVKAIGWYDNEWGYSRRLVDLAALVASKL